MGYHCPYDKVIRLPPFTEKVSTSFPLDALQMEKTKHGRQLSMTIRLNSFRIKT